LNSNAGNLTTTTQQSITGEYQPFLRTTTHDMMLPKEGGGRRVGLLLSSLFLLTFLALVPDPCQPGLIVIGHRTRLTRSGIRDASIRNNTSSSSALLLNKTASSTINAPQISKTLITPIGKTKTSHVGNIQIYLTTRDM
jgi:hypothetical protein